MYSTLPILILSTNQTIADTPATTMKTTDPAADRTLSELFDDLCHSCFDPERIAANMKDMDIVDDPVCLECGRDDLPDYEKRMAVINAVRSNGDPGAFPIFVTILERDPENSVIVQKVKGMVY